MSEEVKLTGMIKTITGETTYSQDSSGGFAPTAYDVYRRDVQEAHIYKVTGRVELDAARAGARRVAWAVARWWREERGKDWEKEFTDELPVALQRVLESEAPD